MADDALPLVTFALLAYNQEQYVRAAIEAAFAQDYRPLQIVLSDDASVDGTYELMAEAVANYCGPHTVVLNRNPRNLNIGDHVNQIGRLARGELVVFSAADDISVSSRTSIVVARWLELGKPSAVLLSDFDGIDKDGELVDMNGEVAFRGPFLIDQMARGEIWGLGATAAVSRDLFTEFPPLDPSVRHEDRVFPFRALLRAGVVESVDAKLVHYRVEGGISRREITSGRDFVHRHIAAASERILPDALQRSADLAASGMESAVLKRACVATIVDHQAEIALTTATRSALEGVVLKFLRAGARPGKLLKLYLKLRFTSLFNVYYRWRFMR